MGRPDTLARFIEEAADLFPADKYGLVLSDHGGAWSGGYVDTGPPSTSQLSIADMRAGIITGMQRGGIDRFEFIEHDSCLMSAYEVASALAPLADVIDRLRGGHLRRPHPRPRRLRQASARTSRARSGVSATSRATPATADRYGDIGDFSALAVVDGDATERLDKAVEAFADVAADNMAEIAPEIARARSRSLEFVSGLLGEEEGAGFSVVDLGDFLRQIKNVPDEVLVARDAAFAALDAAVAAPGDPQGHRAGHRTQRLLPGDPRMAPGSRPSTSLPPAGPSSSRRTPSTPRTRAPSNDANFTSNEADVVEIGPGGIRIAGQLEPGDEENVASSETQVYTQLDGRDALAVVLPAYLNSGGVGQVQGVWNFSVTTLQAGKKRAPASAVYQAQSGGLLGWFQALYTAPNGAQADVEIDVLLSSEGEIESISVKDVTDGGEAGIDLKNGGTLTPYLIVPSSGGFSFELSSKSVPINDRLVVAYPQLAKGTSFDMGVGVADLAGNFSTAFVTDTVR